MTGKQFKDMWRFAWGGRDRHWATNAAKHYAVTASTVRRWAKLRRIPVRVEKAL